MGTTTFFLRNNDIGAPIGSLNKEELGQFDKLSPYGETIFFKGWSVPLELHNGNIHILVFWEGRLMRLEKAPLLLNKKFYSKHKGKYEREYEWTLLKWIIKKDLLLSDREFRKIIRKRKKPHPLNEFDKIN